MVVVSGHKSRSCCVVISSLSIQGPIILLSYETYTHNSNCECLKSFLLLTALAFAVVRMKTELFILSCLLVSSCSATNTTINCNHYF